MLLRYRVQNAARAVAEFLEDRWFDGTRHVRTSGNVSLRHAGIAAEEVRDSELYVPARPANIRQALRETGIRNCSPYSYIDLGSGKGRSLFVAAELPFRQVLGVEFSLLLHEQARENIGHYRGWRRRSGPITSILMNARDFLFPEGPMVLYLFNPFGLETIEHVLGNLERSLRTEPRHVVVVLLWPRCGDQVAKVEGMRLKTTTRRHQIFEVYAPARDMGRELRREHSQP